MSLTRDAQRIRKSNQAQRAMHLIILTLSLAFVFAWGARGLKSDSITPAEYNSIFNVYDNRLDDLSSLAGTWRNVAAKDETHPPGYFLLLNLWSRLVGPDLLPLRLLSIYFGLLAVAFTYRLARLTGSTDQALVAAVVLALMAYFGFYLHEVRMYSLLAMVTVLTVWSYASLVHSTTGDRRRWLIVLFLSAAATIYVHAFGFVLLAAIGLLHLVFIPKNRQWLLVSAAMICAGCLYLPWLPNAIAMLGIRTSFASDSLTWHESVRAFASIYNNGFSIFAPACAAILVLNRHRLGASQRYMAILVALVLLATLGLNEVAPIIVARRIRYSIILAPLWACMLAIAVSLLPRWELLKLPVFFIWLFAFLTYDQSSALYLFTNSLDQNRHKIPHYQTLLYEPGLPIRRSDYVVSFQNDTVLSRKTLDYYGRKIGNWRGLFHIWYDDSGDPAVQSTDTRYDRVPSMARWNFPLWLIYNPEETDLQTMPVFTDDFLMRFHSCGRYLETANTVIELYIMQSLPCQLLTADSPQALSYDNGTELANILVEPKAGVLDISLWWTNTFANKYAISIQLFDDQDLKAAQLDEVVGGDPLRGYSLDLSALAPGDYMVKLILYDFETGSVQAGTIIADERPFKRAVDVGRISISG